MNYPLYVPESCEQAATLISRGRVDEAIRHIELKAAFGDSGAAALLGYLQIRGALANPRLDLIQHALRRAANDGDPFAEFVFALGMRSLGQTELSSHWMQRSANHLFPPAQAHLGGYLMEGVGFDKPCRDSALVMFKLALLNRHVPTLGFLTNWLSRSSEWSHRSLGMLLRPVSMVVIAVQFWLRPFSVLTVFHVQDDCRPLFARRSRGM